MKSNIKTSKKHTLSFTAGAALFSLSTLALPPRAQAAVEQWTNGDWKITRWGGADVMRCDLDSQGNLWYGTQNGGLNWFDGSEVYRFTDGGNISQSHLFQTLYIDEQDTVFWSHDFDVIKVYNKTLAGTINGYSPYALGKSPDGTLYGSSGGASKYENGVWVTDSTYTSADNTSWNRELIFTSDSTFWRFNGSSAVYHTPHFNSIYYSSNDIALISDSAMVATGSLSGAALIPVNTNVKEYISGTDWTPNNYWLKYPVNDPQSTYPFASPNNTYTGGLGVDANGLVWVGGTGIIATFDPASYTWEAWTGIDTLEAKISDIRIKGNKLIACASGTFYEYTGTKHLPSSSSPSSSSDLSSSSSDPSPLLNRQLPTQLQVAEQHLLGQAQFAGLITLKVYNSVGQTLGAASFDVQAGQSLHLPLPGLEQHQGPWHLEVYFKGGLKGEVDQRVLRYHVMR